MTVGMFLDTDAASVYEAVISAVQERCGEVLPEGDERRLFAEGMVAYMLAVRSDVEDAARQKMLAYARGEVLDAIGEMYGCARIVSQPSACTLRFSLAEPRSVATPVPAGTVASTPDGHAFATDADAEVAAGDVSCDAAATAVEPGTASDGYVPGSVTVLQSAVAYVATVTNAGTTGGGVDGEADDDEGNASYRARILLAQNAVNTVGTESSYKFHAMSADTSIADVQVPEPEQACRITVYVVGKGGAQLGADALAAVQAAVSADDVRPLGDVVTVVNAARREYEVGLSYTCPAGNEAAVVEAVEGEGGAVSQYLEWQDETISRAISPQKLMALCFAAGAETVEVASPAAAEVGVGEVAKCVSSTVSHGVV